MLSEYTAKLSNCALSRIDVDLDHHYYGNGEYYLSLTHVLDIGAPFPEGLRSWLRRTSEEESMDVLNMTKDRGTKLHRALDNLALGMELYMEDYPSDYEKDALVTFIRTIRFLNPKDFKTELIVADAKLRVGGTLDFVGMADGRRLDVLANPLGKIKLQGDNFVLTKPLLGRARPTKFVMDYKFTGRSNYNHRVQASKYKEMFNMSYADERKATKAYIWRYSPKHKLHFDMKETKLRPSSFNRIYHTALEYWGKFPEPPAMVVYPERVRLFDKVKESK